MADYWAFLMVHGTIRAWIWSDGPPPSDKVGVFPIFSCSWLEGATLLCFRLYNEHNLEFLFMLWSPCQVDRADVTVELWNPLGELYLMRETFVQRKTTDPGGVISSLTFRRAKSSATRIPTFPQCC